MSVSPFRDEREAARAALVSLLREKEELVQALARAEDDVRALRGTRWVTGVRVVALAVTFGVAAYVGYHASGAACAQPSPQLAGPVQ